MEKTKKVASNATKTTTKVKKNRIPTTSQSVNNGIKLLKAAIKKDISVSTAAKINGKGKNYVYAIAEKITKHKQGGRITNEQYNDFTSLYKKATR